MAHYCRIRFSISILLFLILGFSCTSKKVEIVRSYYYWRTESGIVEEEKQFLKGHGIKKLYSKLMDVDWSVVYGAYPVVSRDIDQFNLSLNGYDSLNLNVVPVIFLTNQVFQKIDSAHIPLLAKRILRRCLPAYDSVDKAYESRHPLYHYRSADRLKTGEIQFGCDWTVGTAKKYFYFLEQVRAQLPHDSIQVSATVRLHQYKYLQKTGIPPVDRGMLMVYNITDLRRYALTNSIFDLDNATAYFNDTKPYPLPLDIALAAYSWSIIFRNREFYQIENGLSERDLQACSFLEPIGNHFYRVTKDTVFRKLFLRPGDEIKAEGIDAARLKEAATLAKKAVNSKSYSVALFELSASEIKNYSHEAIEAAYHTFR